MAKAKNTKRSARSTTASVERPRAVAAICLVWRSAKKDTVALIKRREDHPHHLSGQWFFPGGGVGVHEHPHDAASRETLEECGVTTNEPTIVDAFSLVEYWSHKGVAYQQPVLLAVYEAVYTGGVLAPVDECTDAAWVPLSDLRTYLVKDTISSHLTEKVRSVLGLA